MFLPTGGCAGETTCITEVARRYFEFVLKPWRMVVYLCHAPPQVPLCLKFYLGLFHGPVGSVPVAVHAVDAAIVGSRRAPLDVMFRSWNRLSGCVGLCPWCTAHGRGVLLARAEFGASLCWLCCQLAPYRPWRALFSIVACWLESGWIAAHVR